MAHIKDSADYIDGYSLDYTRIGVASAITTTSGPDVVATLSSVEPPSFLSNDLAGIDAFGLTFAHDDTCLDPRLGHLACSGRFSPWAHPTGRHDPINYTPRLPQRASIAAPLSQTQFASTAFFPSSQFDLEPLFGGDRGEDACSIDCNSQCCDPCTASQCEWSMEDEPCRDAACVATPCSDVTCTATAMTPGEKAAAETLAFIAAREAAPPPPSQSTSHKPSPSISFLSSPGHASLDSASSSILGSGSSGFSRQFQPTANYLDEPMTALEDIELSSLYHHVLTQHDPQLESHCVQPCMLDNYGHQFQTCVLPRYCFPNAGMGGTSYPPWGPELPVSQCGANIPNLWAFVEHFNAEHRTGAKSAGQSKPPEPGSLSQHPLTLEAIPESAPMASPLEATMSGDSITERRFSGASPRQVQPEEPSVADSAGRPTFEASHQASPIEPKFICMWQDGAISQSCDVDFASGEELHKHIREKHLRNFRRSDHEKNFMCQWGSCSRRDGFTQKSKLERHLQSHTGFKPVKCPDCGLALSATQSLKQHRRIHTGEKPWQCAFPGCSKAFKQQSALTMHTRIHTGEKPLKCPKCDKRFGESSGLSKHIRTHEMKGANVCPHCNRDFCRLDQLRRHLKIHERGKVMDAADRHG